MDVAWWGPSLHREHEDKIRAQLRELYAGVFTCSHDGCAQLVGVTWLSKWREHEDGHGRIRALFYDTAGSYFAMRDHDVTRDGRIIVPQLVAVQSLSLALGGA